MLRNQVQRAEFQRGFALPVTGRIVTEFVRLTPSFIVEDVARSLAFYEALGFTRWHTVPAHAPFEMGMVGAGGVRLMFWDRKAMMQSIPQLGSVDPGRGGPLLQFVEVVGIDELYARVMGLGVTVLQDIATDENGMRQFKIQDCDGWRMLFSGRT